LPVETYLVGGAVRDKLLGLPVRERDWVVVGSTPEEMLARGYTPVGRDFPVFLHPQTRDEYALARTERKTGHGYTGFATCSDPGITLEQDLLRRDLTINAMAETAAGELIDPYGGRADLQNGVLRHVSPAFAEDPVRILRIARFAARFAPLGFHVAHDTNKLMRAMVAQGEVDYLVPERVWAELVKALAEAAPARFFAVLQGCGALERLFPEMQPLASAGNGHQRNAIALPVLGAAVALSDNSCIRFAAWICDLDNGTPGGLPDAALQALCTRQRAPNACRELALMALRHRTQVHTAAGLGAEDLLALLEALDAFRRGERLEQLLLVCEADARAANPGLAEYAPAALLRQARNAARAVRADTRPGVAGKEIGAQLQRQRVAAIRQMLAPGPG
jgi:tRNA nucleotidyltransferase (CCA-adding enzyme)